MTTHDQARRLAALRGLARLETDEHLAWPYTHRTWLDVPFGEMCTAMVKDFSVLTAYLDLPAADREHTLTRYAWLCVYRLTQTLMNDAERAYLADHPYLPYRSIRATDTEMQDDLRRFVRDTMGNQPLAEALGRAVLHPALRADAEADVDASVSQGPATMRHVVALNVHSESMLRRLAYPCAPTLGRAARPARALWS
jgi:hypothetical protein